MYKLLVSVYVLTLSLSTFTHAATYGGGSGTELDPYQIWTPEQMNTIGLNPDDWDKHFKLMADIDMSMYTGTQYNIIGTDYPQHAFTGTFDGDGHVIRNLTYTTSSPVFYVGVFGCTHEAVIQNLGVENVSISSNGDAVGGLVGFNGYSSTIYNCYTTGTVNGGEWVGGLVGGTSTSSCIIDCRDSVLVTGIKFIGGLVGRNFGGSITTCYANSSVKGGDCTGGLVGSNVDGFVIFSHAACSVIGTGYDAGGLIGYQDTSIVSTCYATGSVSGQEDYVGGLIGYSSESTITDCYATCSVTTSYSSFVGGLVGNNSDGFITGCYACGSVIGWSAIGGLVGSSNGTIIACYATGSISGKSHIGGLVGSSVAGAIVDCYAAGSVNPTYYATNVGGLAGSDRGSSIVSCFWDTQTSSQITSAGGIGKTTAEMMTLSTFTSAGWDFANETVNGNSNYWRMCIDGVDYPRLNWESIDGDFACPDGVSTEDLNYYSDWWLMNDCTTDNNYCGSADLNYSGTVDLADLSILATNWLK